MYICIYVYVYHSSGDSFIYIYDISTYSASDKLFFFFFYLRLFFFVFLLFWGRVMHANEVETKEKLKITWDKELSTQRLILLGSQRNNDVF